MAVADEPGQAVLHLIAESDTGARLDTGWNETLEEIFGVAPTAAGSEDVLVTTLDDLINEYGEPALVKIDTEGSDHLVLRGLSRPIEHVFVRGGCRSS
jgi:FkbM family methyltransferase